MYHDSRCFRALQVIARNGKAWQVIARQSEAYQVKARHNETSDHRGNATAASLEYVPRLCSLFSPLKIALSLQWRVSNEVSIKSFY